MELGLILEDCRRNSAPEKVLDFSDETPALGSGSGKSHRTSKSLRWNNLESNFDCLFTICLPPANL